VLEGGRNTVFLGKNNLSGAKTSRPDAKIPLIKNHKEDIVCQPQETGFPERGKVFWR
jgi:hypothetical protein